MQTKVSFTQAISPVGREGYSNIRSLNPNIGCVSINYAALKTQKERKCNFKAAFILKPKAEIAIVNRPQWSLNLLIEFPNLLWLEFGKQLVRVVRENARSWC